MKTELGQNQQMRLGTRNGALFVAIETALDDGPSGASSAAMRQWFRVEEPGVDSALVAGRPVRNVDPKEGLFGDEEGNSYRLVGGGQARPAYAEIVPAEDDPERLPGAGAPALPTKRRGGDRLGGASQRRRKGGVKTWRPCERAGLRTSETK